MTSDVEGRNWKADSVRWDYETLGHRRYVAIFLRSDGWAKAFGHWSSYNVNVESNGKDQNDNMPDGDFSLRLYNMEQEHDWCVIMYFMDSKGWIFSRHLKLLIFLAAVWKKNTWIAWTLSLMAAWAFFIWLESGWQSFHEDHYLYDRPVLENIHLWNL